MSLMGTPASAATTAETKLNQSITGGEHNIAVTPVSNFNAVTLSGETQVTNAKSWCPNGDRCNRFRGWLENQCKSRSI